MPSYAILAGAPSQYRPNLDDERFRQCRWIGVDRGAYDLYKKGIQPVRSFGDFDSITDEERQRMNSHSLHMDIFPSEKDDTDLAIAIDWVMEQDADACFVIGATGGRLDHTLMNVQLLYKSLTSGVAVYLVDQQNTVTLLAPGYHEIKSVSSYEYHSFIAFSKKVRGITLDGFKYPLNKAELSWGSSLCISNELVGKSGSLDFTSGYLLHIMSRDADH
ncbi:thiamine diphosphokinase [Tuberibacillus sp. Marseille-P3662]|uniref:thiamine diphosphokinase n=1 Tax=Tuberibacillus sp. Marseille-P3662 TaxID=1965358 RepID=UPI000A1CC831|nr:thiamine diphosphokinase [Tuberibacillus sp. Marseille-P3662]